MSRGVSGWAGPPLSVGHHIHPDDVRRVPAQRVLELGDQRLDLRSDWPVVDVHPGQDPELTRSEKGHQQLADPRDPAPEP